MQTAHPEFFLQQTGAFHYGSHKLEAAPSVHFIFAANIRCQQDDHIWVDLCNEYLDQVKCKLRYPLF